MSNETKLIESEESYQMRHLKRNNHIDPAAAVVVGGSEEFRSQSRNTTTPIDLPGQEQFGHLILNVSRNANPQELEALLADGISPNVVDATGRSPLHLAVSSGCSCETCVNDAEACVRLLLLSNGVDVNLQDEMGNTALHMAIDNQLSRCSQLLVSCGADVNLMNNSGLSPVQLMSRKMPQCLVHLLNESVYVDKYDPHHEKCVLKVDLRPLSGFTQTQSVWSSDHNAEMKDGSKPKEKVTTIFTSTTTEISTLMDLSERNKFAKEQFLTHPVVKVFLHLKWQKIRGFFWASLVCYLFWAMLYTSYVLQVYVFSCPCQLFRRSRQDVATTSKCEIETGLGLQVMLIVVSTSLLLLIELGKLWLTPKIYLRGWLNLGHWVLITSVFATTIPNLQAQTSISAAQYQVAAFTVFLAWAYVLPQVARLPSFAKYLETFGHVLKCFGTFMLTFLSLYMGFSLSLCILFFGDETSPFANFFHSFVKVLVMAVGELDYQEMFYGNPDETQEMQSVAMGHLLYAIFAVLICIVCMNLFVALTVSDVQMLERKAEFSRIRRLILEIFHLESLLFSKRVPRIFRNLLRRSLLINGTTFSFHPNDPRDKSIPTSLSRETLHLAETSFRKARSQRCFRKTELVEIQTFFPNTEDATKHDPTTKLPPSPSRASSSSTSSSHSSTPLETNSLDLGNNLPPPPLAHFRPWASCLDHTNYTFT